MLQLSTGRVLRQEDHEFKSGLGSIVMQQDLFF